MKHLLPIALAVATASLVSCNTLTGLLRPSAGASSTSAASAVATAGGLVRPVTELDIMRLQIIDRMSARIANRPQGGAQ